MVVAVVVVAALAFVFVTLGTMLRKAGMREAGAMLDGLA